MRWTSWLPLARSRTLCVVGLDIGPEVCSLVVLTGSTLQAQSVCCAERLTLPEGCFASGEVLRPEALGQWLRSYLDMGDYQASGLFIGIDGAGVSNHRMRVAAGLSPDDVLFQLQAELQSLLPQPTEPMCIDYSVDTEQAAAGEQMYGVQAVSEHAVARLMRVAHAAGLKLCVIEPRHEAAARTEVQGVLSGLPQAGAALALQHAEAFGAALRAWHGAGCNFLPHRRTSEHALRRVWFLGMSLCLMGGAFVATGFAWAMTAAAETKRQEMGDMTASALAFEKARQANDEVKAMQARQAEQGRWLVTRQGVQSQSLQWGRVLSQATSGVWVSSLSQQGARWSLQGEALSSAHAQQLVQQLKALDIWSQGPELPQLQLMPAASHVGWPVWQFRIEADLKEGE